MRPGWKRISPLAVARWSRNQTNRYTSNGSGWPHGFLDSSELIFALADWQHNKGTSKTDTNPGSGKWNFGKLEKVRLWESFKYSQDEVGCLNYPAIPVSLRLDPHILGRFKKKSGGKNESSEYYPEIWFATWNRKQFLTEHFSFGKTCLNRHVISSSSVTSFICRVLEQSFLPDSNKPFAPRGWGFLKRYSRYRSEGDQLEHFKYIFTLGIIPGVVMNFIWNLIDRPWNGKGALSVRFTITSFSFSRRGKHRPSFRMEKRESPFVKFWKTVSSDYTLPSMQDLKWNTADNKRSRVLILEIIHFQITPCFLVNFNRGKGTKLLQQRKHWPTVIAYVFQFNGKTKTVKSLK